MDSTRLTDEQINRLRQQIAQNLRQLTRLQQRMDRLGFPPDDRLYSATLAAHHAVHALHVVSIYLRPNGWAG